MLLGDDRVPAIKFKGFIRSAEGGTPVKLVAKSRKVTPKPKAAHKKAKRGPGRPPGVKNKPKKRPVGRPPKKRGRGRPKGSKNKPKSGPITII
jgi:hypothetical protein